MNNVKITNTQQKILVEVQIAKQNLQSEFNKLTQKETELITMIAESAGLTLAPGTSVELKDGELCFGVSTVDKKEKKLKKVE